MLNQWYNWLSYRLCLTNILNDFKTASKIKLLIIAKQLKNTEEKITEKFFYK